MPTWTKGALDDSVIPADLQLVGLGVGLTGIAKILQTITPASVAANTTVEQTFTVPGLALGDNVDVSTPSLVTGVSVTNCRVSAVNTLAIQFANNTAGALTPPVGTYNILVVR